MTANLVRHRAGGRSRVPRRRAVGRHRRAELRSRRHFATRQITIMALRAKAGAEERTFVSAVRSGLGSLWLSSMAPISVVDDVGRPRHAEYEEPTMSGVGID